MLALVVVGGAPACGGSTPEGPTPPPATSTQINPARIDRARDALPPGYETADIAGPVTPAGLWGYGDAWVADPPECAVLADPAGAATATGWSASGPGGIVYAVVAPAGDTPDATVLLECRQWDVVGGRTAGRVSLVRAPTLEGARVVALATVSTTVVEGGTETRSHADTVTAYLGDHVAFVSVVTDPGSPEPQLGPDFAEGLIARTVSAVRGG